MLRPAYLLVILVCFAPTLPGVVGVILSAFSYVPPLDLKHASLQGFIAAFSWTGVGTSIGLTLFSSLTSSILACLLTFAVLQATWRSRYWSWLEKSLSPLLAIPHVAFAIGFAFLFSPTGVVARLVEHLLGNTNLAVLVNDPYAIGLTIALTIKELPFLLLMSLPIIQQLRLEHSYKIATSLGYSNNAFWFKCVFPQWLTKIRFPMVAIIAYSVSVVDMSLIVGPTNPPTFAVLVWQWLSDPDLALFPRAAAGAVILFLLCVALVLMFKWIGHCLLNANRGWQFSGRSALKLPGKSVFSVVLLVNLFIVPITLLWSLAQRWRFPDLLPSRFSLRFWQQEWDSILATMSTSLMIATTTASIALLLALIAHEYRQQHRVHVPNLIIAIPMLVPQLSILFGLQVVTLYFEHQQPLFWVIWSHVFFAFPYVYLALDGPWRSYNQGYTQTALSLGKSPIQVWLRVKLPLLFPAVTFAWAIGASVSLAQYLPTLMLGAGRVATVTTEAVALSSGFDRRVTAIYAIWQALLPLLFFASAFLFNRLHRHRFKPIRKVPFNESLSKKPHRL